MRLAVRVLGAEVFAVELDTTPHEQGSDDHELTATSHQGGDFGFAGTSQRPFWTSEPGESPAVAEVT